MRAVHAMSVSQNAMDNNHSAAAALRLRYNVGIQQGSGNGEKELLATE
ncbi:hypothetical protein EYZ11_013590 [Aspergillus tanneri]|uniref:Uncharacterized protein n=1 Tax=Aspergillus tanneri TaxID=1220188 RepID=A0A4V3UME5_9EURO|nr:hypothetical protein EYZ11_013590 [Aspergillus tanneri]